MADWYIAKWLSMSWFRLILCLVPCELSCTPEMENSKRSSLPKIEGILHRSLVMYLAKGADRTSDG